MASKIEFVVNGASYRLSRSQVERAIRGEKPERVVTHGVVVGGQTFPVKQVFAKATGLDLLDFTSAVARRNLAKLEFELVRRSG